ncbi:MAG: hypothetical protein ABR558_01105 [Thioalkalivibrio sp.]
MPGGHHRPGGPGCLVIPRPQRAVVGIAASALVAWGPCPGKSPESVTRHGLRTSHVIIRQELIADIMAQDERILKEPVPTIVLGDNSVDFNVRPWVKTADYWPVRADLLENVKLANPRQATAGGFL